MEMATTDPQKPRGYGRALARLFRNLGYDDGTLHADMFEWLFGLPSMRIQAFLDWFLSSVRPRQSVKRQLGGAQDYAIYLALLRGEIGDGHGLLTGDQLARAEMAMQQSSGRDGDESLDALTAANGKLEREIHELENRLRLANEKNDRLAKLVQRHMLVTDEQTQRVQRQQDKDHFNEIIAHIAPSSRRAQTRAKTPEEVVARIQASLQHLATPAGASSSQTMIPSSSSSSLVAASSLEILAPSSSSSLGLSHREAPCKWKDFLYRHSLKQLEALEDQNLRDLQSRIPAISALSSTAKIQTNDDQQPESSFDVAMSPMPTHRRRQNDREVVPPPSPWLHESDPVQLNLREQDTLLYNKCCVELERLRRAYVVGEQDALLAQLQVTRYEAHLRQLTSSRRQLLQQFQLMSRDAIWARKQILQSSLDKTKKQLGELFQGAFPTKLEELAFLKSTSILLQSYEQKLWRQENRFVKLRHLLEGFEMQHARLRLVHRLLDAERRDLLQVDGIFQQLLTSLRDHNERTERRIVSYDTTAGSDAARNTLSQTYLHEQDDMAHRLFAILERIVNHEAHDREQLTNQSFRLRTFDELVRLGELKCANDETMKTNEALLQAEWTRLYESKRYTLGQLRRELFGDATSSTPLLLPADLGKALKQACDTKDAAELGIEKALETLRLHRRSVQVDPSKWMQQERDLARIRRELQEIQ